MENGVHCRDIYAWQQEKFNKLKENFETEKMGNANACSF